jgi:carbon storage regulator CsrA
MLVLSRKVGEKIVLGDNVTIVINRIAGHRVSIGIEAPRDMRVLRSELGPRENGADREPGANGFSDPANTAGAAAASAVVRPIR